MSGQDDIKVLQVSRFANGVKGDASPVDKPNVATEMMMQEAGVTPWDVIEVFLSLTRHDVRFWY